MLLAGCSTTSKKPVEVTDHIKIAIECNTTAPRADELVMLEVDPMPVTDTSGQQWVGLTPKHYENLAINLQRMLGYMRQKNAIVQYYKKCIDQFNASVYAK